ncbi:hypothetical protein GCM10027413_15170 [Conyzicola nivalis]|uniref:Uncharacterized protein n=1 Tax=Conyzicola nivalis TaxID=1477021 RepID=A0A916WGH8_9MICO|nr:hypothetical protein [Conyzicola nivalis]GGA98660.1 hypothetical protein GCM10010979_11450 [Conyzicola nivalis]
MLRALGALLRVDLEPRTLQLPGNLRVEVEGIDQAESVLVQLVPYLGEARSTHRMGALADMFKLVWLRGVLPTRPRLVLCVAEPQARFFTSASWPLSAAKAQQVDVYSFHTADGSLHLLTA